MIRYILRRLIWVVVLLFAVSFVTFVIFYLLPSADPAVLRAGRQANPALVASIRHQLGLDRVPHARPLGRVDDRVRAARVVERRHGGGDHFGGVLRTRKANV